MTAGGNHGNKGYLYPETGSYEMFVKSVDNAKVAAKRNPITTGPRITSTDMGLEAQSQEITGYFNTVNSASADTISKLHAAALTLTRPFPCINNILLPGMILTVTAGTDIFPEFPSGSKWMVDKYTINQVITKGTNRYEFGIILLRYTGV
jgi:hypothetical protein